MLGNFEFVRGATFGVLLGGNNAALRFHGVRKLVEADQRESIAVDIAETRKDAAPDRRFFAEKHSRSATRVRVCGLTGGSSRYRALRRMKLVSDAFEARRSLEAHAPLGPFLELGGHIFGDEHNLRRATDKLVLLRIGLWGNEGKNGGAIGRRNRNPSFARLHASIISDVEAQLIDEKLQAAVLVANENIHAV